MKYVYIMLKPVRYCLNTMVYLIKLPFKTIRLLGRAVFYRKAKPRRRFKHYKPSKHKHDNYQSQIDLIARKVNECELSLEYHSNRISQRAGARLMNHRTKEINNRLDKLEKEVKEQGSWILKSGKNRLESIEDRITELFKTDISTDKQFDKLEKKVKSLEKANKTHINCFNTIESSHLLYLVNSLEAKVNKMLSENSELTFKPLTKEEEVSLEIAKGECKWDDRTRDYPSEPDFQAEKKAMDKQIAKVKKRDEEFEANLSKNDKIRLNNMSSSTDVSKFNLNPEND